MCLYWPKKFLLIYNTTHTPALDKLRKVVLEHVLNNGQTFRSPAQITRHVSHNVPASHPSSFYVVSPSAIHNQVIKWRRELPFITPHYAVKSNPDPNLLRELYRHGVKYDCASSREIEDCEAFNGGGLGVSKDILFANPVKTEFDMRLACRRGISETVVDSPEEVWRIVHSGWRPSVFIRLAVEDVASRSPFSIKFGAEQRIWKKILDALDMTGLKLGGLSFHIGSACSDNNQYTKAIELCREFSWRTRRNIDAVDIGGGFMPGTFIETASVIRKAILKWETRSDVHFPKRWLAEPGRFFSGVTHTLFTKIIGVKEGPGGVGWRYTLDESIYGQFSCIPFDHQRPYWFRVKCLDSDRNKDDNENKREYGRGFLFGRTCDSIDLIAFSEKMERLRTNDWLCFPGMGAYTTSSSSEFNGFPKPKVYYQENGWVDPSELKMDPSVIFPIETRSCISLSLDTNSKSYIH